jgi:hypothetical protein
MYNKAAQARYRERHREKLRAKSRSPEYKAYRRAYKKRPEVRAKQIAYNKTAQRTAYNKHWNAQRTEQNGLLIQGAKSVPCMDCGASYPPYVMDFDHVRGKKLFDIGRMRSQTAAKIMSEIAKCDVVCANCHRIRTYGGKRPLSPPPHPELLTPWN